MKAAPPPPLPSLTTTDPHQGIFPPEKDDTFNMSEQMETEFQTVPSPKLKLLKVQLHSTPIILSVWPDCQQYKHFFKERTVWFINLKGISTAIGQ